ncbi:MAG: hypothetical protein HY507_00375 [Candidatus Zambryskibacteria bacterium]|nr:hypothetical protein [Candidatus Zambryskibacteria bacterium]
MQIIRSCIVIVILVGIIGGVLSAQKKADIKLRCDELYQESMRYLDVAEKSEPPIGGDMTNTFSFRANFFAKSAAYGIAYQNCIARNK